MGTVRGPNFPLSRDREALKGWCLRWVVAWQHEWSVEQA